MCVLFFFFFFFWSYYFAMMGVIYPAVYLEKKKEMEKNRVGQRLYFAGAGNVLPSERGRFFFFLTTRCTEFTR